jgi:hypothetical protein
MIDLVDMRRDLVVEELLGRLGNRVMFGREIFRREDFFRRARRPWSWVCLSELRWSWLPLITSLSLWGRMESCSRLVTGISAPKN